MPEPEQMVPLAVEWADDHIVMLDQRKLPHSVETFKIHDAGDLADSIKDMAVRGAPAIGVAAAYGMALAYVNHDDPDLASLVIEASRPTAKDLFTAVDRIKQAWFDGEDPVKTALEYARGIETACRRIGELGEPLIEDGMKVMTHCNAGALATVYWGTALAPMRFAKYAGKEIFVWVDETRPRLQGGRLTAWELHQEGIDHAVIADNAAGHYMSRGEVDLMIVGADRIAMNGDFANKIGTYEKAVVAKENDIPFYVAAPETTFDKKAPSGEDIPIEERDDWEVKSWGGNDLMNPSSNAKNPAFDVTPSRFVKGFITEHGILLPEQIFTSLVK